MLGNSSARYLIYGLLLGISCTGLAQVPAQQPQEAAKKARIEGTVVSSTGQPIPRVTVTLRGAVTPATSATAARQETYSATSDAAGKFTIENIEPGTSHTLTSQKTGLDNGAYGARTSNSGSIRIPLSAGQELKGIAIVMTQQGVITGRITDKNGDPVQNAKISLFKPVYVAGFRPVYGSGIRTVTTAGSATSNDQGEYRLANLPAGLYYASVTDPSGARSFTAKDPSNLTTYYPNSPDIQGASPIEVAAGNEQRGIDIQFRKGMTFAIRGKAVNAETGEVVVAAIRATQKNAPPEDFLTRALKSTYQNGTFEILNLAPGTYILQNETGNVTVGGVTAPNLTGRLEVTVADRDVNEVILQLGRGATVTGTVKLENGDIDTLMNAAPPRKSPIPQLTAEAAAKGARVTVTGRTVDLVPVQGAASGQSDRTALLNPDGSFQLESIPVGQYFATFLLPPNYYVKSVTFGGLDMIHNPMDLTSGKGGSLQFVVSDKTGKIKGKVINEKGEPQLNVSVTLWSNLPEAGSPYNGVRTASTDQSGNFQFANLPPGEYSAAAWEDIDRNLGQARDFLTQFNGSAEKAKLAESGSVALTLKVISVEKIKAAEAKLP